MRFTPDCATEDQPRAVDVTIHLLVQRLSAESSRANGREYSEERPMFESHW